MSDTSWTGISGDWADAAEWTGGVPDSPTVTALIGGITPATLTLAGGESFQVAAVSMTDADATFDLAGTLSIARGFTLSAGDITVSGLLAGGTLDNEGGTVGLDDGTLSGVAITGGGAFDVGSYATLDDVANSAVLLAGNGDTLGLAGTIDNADEIELQAGGGGAGLVIAGTVALQGGGTILMSNADGAGNIILGQTLDNIDNTIAGSGYVGHGSMVLINGGVIDADLANALYLGTGASTITNTGTLEADGGVLAIESAVDGGMIEAIGGDSVVRFSGGTLVGVTLATSNGGALTLSGPSTLDDVTTDALLLTGSGATLALLGTITNSGEIELAAAGSVAALAIGGTVTLDGGGTVRLSNVDGTGNVITGGTLDNIDNTIAGTGYIGGGTLVLINGGVIDADQANGMAIDTGTIVINTGVIEDTGGGGLTLDDAIAGGTIEAYGAGAYVFLDGGTIIGGTLVTAGGGVNRIVADTTLDGTGAPVANLGALLDARGLTLTVVGEVGNAGSLLLDGILDDQGSFDNSGTLQAIGVGAYVIGGSVENSGLLDARGTGITITGGGVVGNAAGGTIYGLAGVVFQTYAVGTVYNAGTIESAAGAAGIAVQFGAENDLLEVGGGGVFIGTVDGGLGTNTLELAALAGPGTLAGLGTTYFHYTNFTIFEVDAGATWTLGGAATLESGDTLTDSGILAAADSLVNDGLLLTPGFLEVTGDLDNQATIGALGGIGHGVTLVAAGTVTNDGYVGAISSGIVLRAGGAVVNQGRIDATGAGGVGVYLYRGGTIDNAGTILGGAVGLYMDGGTLANAGLVEASGGGGIGVALSGQGLLSNQAGGVIEGATGALLFGAPGTAPTLVNQGTIDGTGGGAAVVFGGAGGLLVWDAGGVFGGAVEGGGGTLELAAGDAPIGSFGGLGGMLAHFSAVEIDQSADWAMTGVNSLAAAYTIEDAGIWTNDGALIDAGTVTVDGTLANAGLIEVSDGTLTDATALAGGGTIEIADFGVVDLAGPVGGGTIGFADATGILELGDPLAVSASITGFMHGDTIDLTGIAFSDTEKIAYLGGEVTVSQDGTILAELAVSGLPAGATVALADDGHGGTAIVDPVDQPCFLRGTRIRTDRGEIPVEALAVGDRVATLAGRFEPIRWIGRRSSNPAALEIGRETVLPIVIRRGALGDTVPARDLAVSPEHCLYLAASLVPARLLVNGASITQRRGLEPVEYYHVELDRHGVLFAEGAAAESYRENSGNRALFENGAEAAANPCEPCAPLLWDGVALDRVRHALLIRAVDSGCAATDDPALRLAADGRVLAPASVEDGIYRFSLDRRPASLRLISRTGVPAWRGGSADSRMLGVNVVKLVLWCGSAAVEIPHWEPALSEGFHADEPTHRWTDGDAAIPPHLFAGLSGNLTVEIHTLSSTLRYWAEPSDGFAAAS